MDFICIGELVNTHGIKGEVRILSDFKYKDKAFCIGNHLYIGKKKEDLIIKTYRVHKNYDMVTFEGINDINDVIIYKGEFVYIDKNSLDTALYLDEDLINLRVIMNDRQVGTVVSLKKSVLYTLLVVSSNQKEYLVPNIEEFIDKIDFDNKIIFVKDIKGLFDENWYFNSFS